MTNPPSQDPSQGEPPYGQPPSGQAPQGQPPQGPPSGWQPPQGPPSGWSPEGPPQAWGGEGPPPTGGDRSKLPFIIAGAVALVVVAVALGLFFLLRGGDSPESVAEDYAQALVDADCDQMVSHMSENLKNQFGTCDENADAIEEMESQGSRIQLGDASVKDENDDSAQVEIAYTEETEEGESEEGTVTFALVKEDGEWKVDNFGEGSEGGDSTETEPDE